MGVWEVHADEVVLAEDLVGDRVVVDTAVHVEVGLLHSEEAVVEEGAAVPLTSPLKPAAVAAAVEGEQAAVSEVLRKKK